MPNTTSLHLNSTASYTLQSNRSTLISKNITVRGRRTSIRLEPEMWDALRDIAYREATTIHNICSLISMRKDRDTSLTAAIRVFMMLYFRAATTSEGHIRAGHGSFENMKRRARVTDEYLKENISNDTVN